jgi:hypothetical protein
VPRNLIGSEKARRGIGYPRLSGPLVVKQLYDPDRDLLDRFRPEFGCRTAHARQPSGGA